MPVAKRCFTHIRKLNVAFRAGVHEQVALCRVELRRGDNFRKLFHIRGLDVHDIFENSQYRTIVSSGDTH